VAYSVIPVWEALRHQQDAKVFVLHSAAESCVIVNDVQALVVGNTGLNVGLTMKSLRHLSSSSVNQATISPLTPTFHNALGTVIWNIATLIEQTELPRQYNFSAGKRRLSLFAKKGLFQPLGTRSTPAEVVEFCKAISATDYSLKYAIANCEPEGISAKNDPLSLIQALDGQVETAAEQSWIFTSDGGLLQYPKGQNLTTFLEMRDLIAALFQFQKSIEATGSIRLDVFDADLRKTLAIKSQDFQNYQVHSF
jgi:hypothetical protein